MKHFKIGVAALFLPGLILAGCDGVLSSDTTASSRVYFDLSALRKGSTLYTQDDCAWEVESAELLAISDGEVTVFPRVTIEDPTESFTIDIDNIKKGKTEFTARVFSNNNLLLFDGSTTQKIKKDGFEVPINLEARGSVMEVCPRRLVMQPIADPIDEFEFFGVVEVRNLGNQEFLWDVQSPDFNNFNFLPDGDVVSARPQGAAPTTTTLTVEAVAPVNSVMKIASPKGSVEISIEF